MRLLKYLLVVVTLVSWVAGLLLAYVPGYSEWFFYFASGCYLAVIVCALSALFRRKWSALAVFVFPLAVLFLPAQPSQWLLATGFSIYASPIEEYLSRCRMITFVEDGEGQQVGECQGLATSGITWNVVIYDTTGQFMLPLARRTQAWKDAMGMLSSPKVFAESEGRGSHIVGQFYSIVIRIDEDQGG
jgi:hypothetical protein